jgi:predicted amidohydrolase
MRLALAQIDSLLGDLEGNLERARKVLDAARRAAADIVVFPELALTGYSLGQVEHDVTVSAVDARLVSLSGAGCGVLIGFHERGQRVHTYNTAAYYEAGALVHAQRKIYLPTYDVYEERKHFTAGPTLRAFDTRAGRMATLICNDVWQPVLPFLAAQDGAEVLFVPTNSAESRFPDVLDTVSYWRELTRFHARMFQLYVVFVNRVGEEGELRFWGGSHVVDPWGRLVAEAAAPGEDLVICDLDLGAVRHRRRELPLLKEARLALLRRELDRLIDEGGDL